MFIAVFVAYYLLGIRQHMSMGAMLTHTEHGFGSIANILLIIGAGGAFNAILKTSGLADSLAHILSNLHMHPILLAWLVALVLHAAVGSATVAMMGATAIVAPMLPLYPDVSRDHHHCYRFRRHWLHDRHRFSLLAGEAILRRNPE